MPVFARKVQNLFSLPHHHNFGLPSTRLPGSSNILHGSHSFLFARFLWTRAGRPPVLQVLACTLLGQGENSRTPSLQSSNMKTKLAQLKDMFTYVPRSMFHCTCFVNRKTLTFTTGNGKCNTFSWVCRSLAIKTVTLHA